MADKITVGLQEIDQRYIDYLDQNMMDSEVFINIIFNFIFFTDPLHYRSLPIIHRHN